MKVVLLAPTPPPTGGISSWTERMMNCTLKNDWKVVVVDEKLIGGRTTYGASSKINFFVEIKRCFRIWSDLNKALKERDAAVVQACIPAGLNSMIREYISAIITKLHKRKFIVHFRCTVPNMVKSKLSRFVYKRLLKLCDCVFVLNRQSLRFSQELCPKNKYELIPNFVDITEVYDRETYSENIGKIIYVGGVIPQKGCERMVDVARKRPDIEFRMIGKVGISVENLPANVVLCGEQDKKTVETELAEADVFMFLSNFLGEGFSNALAEAMANSLPCIVTDWAANADMIEDKGGVVVASADNGDLDEILCAIKKIADKETRRKMGEWNRDRVLNCYSQKIITDMYVDAYESLLSK